MVKLNDIVILYGSDVVPTPLRVIEVAPNQLRAVFLDSSNEGYTLINENNRWFLEENSSIETQIVNGRDWLLNRSKFQDLSQLELEHVLINTDKDSEALNICFSSKQILDRCRSNDDIWKERLGYIFPPALKYKPNDMSWFDYFFSKDVYILRKLYEHRDKVAIHPPPTNVGQSHSEGVYITGVDERPVQRSPLHSPARITPLILQILKDGDILAIQYLLDNYPEFVSSFGDLYFDLLLYYNHKNIIGFIINNYPSVRDNLVRERVFKYAIIGKNIELVKQLLQPIPPYATQYFHEATASGSIPMVKLFMETIPNLANLGYFSSFFAGAPLNVIHYYESIRKLTQAFAKEVFEFTRHLDVIEYLFSKGFKPAPSTVKKMCYINVDGIIELLHRHNIPLTNECLQNAATFGNMTNVKYLIETVGITPDQNAVDIAMRTGHAEVGEYIHSVLEGSKIYGYFAIKPEMTVKDIIRLQKSGYEFTSKTLVEALKNPPVFYYLLKIGVKPDSKVLVSAIMNEDTDIVRLLVSEYGLALNTAEFREASRAFINNDVWDSVIEANALPAKRYIQKVVDGGNVPSGLVEKLRSAGIID